MTRAKSNGAEEVGLFENVSQRAFVILKLWRKVAKTSFCCQQISEASCQQDGDRLTSVFCPTLIFTVAWRGDIHPFISRSFSVNILLLVLAIEIEK